MILRVFGAKIAKGVHIYPTVRIAIPWNIKVSEYVAIGDRVTLYSLGKISIGARSTISQGSHLCAGSHDIRLPDRPLQKLPITINRDVWVAADTFIGPGVTIGSGSIVGARGVVMKDVLEYSIVAGNPAKVISTLQQLP